MLDPGVGESGPEDVSPGERTGDDLEDVEGDGDSQSAKVHRRQVVEEDLYCMEEGAHVASLDDRGNGSAPRAYHGPMESLYNPQGVEERWQRTWEDEGLYDAEPGAGASPSSSPTRPRT